MRPTPRRLAALAALILVIALPGFASANHAWGSYHWARQSNPFTLQVDDNVSSTWDSYLATARSDWSTSTVLDLANGSMRTSPRTCRAKAGRVEVCNGSYGNNGWLGVASIWASGSHITQATVKVNDTYFNTASYNTTAWRNLVMCQEVGHTFGLNHQDENFNNANLGTCMDYTSDPSTNQHPNTGDYDQLLCIYDPATSGFTLKTSTHSCTGTGHLDTTTTVGAAALNAAASQSWQSEFGRQVATTNNGKTAVFVRDLGAGQVVISFVIWA